MKKGTKNNKGVEKYLTPILLVIIMILLIIIMVLCLKKDHNVINSNPNPTYNETNDFDESEENPDTSNYISSANALDIALKSLNIKKSAIYDLNIELEKKYGEAVYEIDFNYNRFEYEFYVDAITGKILHSFKEFD